MSTTAHVHLAYREGLYSYKKNKGKNINPYDLGTQSYNAFERGGLKPLKSYLIQ